ncbi:histone acetylation protein-domain-containing protein [Dactylonectria estremocensis]|uniref:histone acetyltransferase n=1 Tax=Dactylonectria estremocensis TaxID=1079267 RepID=A0A9P9EV80_9HYPO|nr:histone acetylation protein-domain-containing protein [Dactylonectria estremocensis]
MTPQHDDDSGLRSRLVGVLPKGYDFGIYHISTPPTKSDPLYSPPPNERPERTYCENHFLAVSIDASNTSPTSTETDVATDENTKKQVLVLGVEVFIYTTARSTTLFVSKADSTGYLHLLGLPKGTPSPIREICATFVGYLVEKRRRKDVQFIVSLFARAQDQYLFPGSVDYSGKHVLDDRGLIKWWCRVLDPLLGPAPVGTTAPWKSSKAYLLVPGLETYEMKALVPRNAAASSWSLAHPLERISHYYREFDWVPPRCLIPHFPDDPKSRFRDELDEEADRSRVMKTTGSWKSVKTLDTFWEMMAYRQECSSGRMTGFIWVVFDDVEETPTTTPPSAVSSQPTASSQPTTAPETPKKQRTVTCVTPNTTPRKLFPSKAGLAKLDQVKARKKRTPKKKTLKGPIIPRNPRVKKEQRNYLLKRPASTAYYLWPTQGRGEKIVDENEYKRIVELLLHLEFTSLNKAATSTRRWVGEVGAGHMWGAIVTGTREFPAPLGNGAGAGGQINNLSGLIKRKRTDSASMAPEEPNNKVNVLSAGLVKRKSKEEDVVTASDDQQEAAVNVLSVGLVRKKPKA